MQEGGSGKCNGASPLMGRSPHFDDGQQTMPAMVELVEWMPLAGREERRKVARVQGRQNDSSGSDPFLALTGGVSLGGDTQPKKRNTVDITADCKLGRREFSEDKAKEVTAMVAALAMSLSLKVKTLESIAIYRSEIDATAFVAAEAKMRTTAFHTQQMEIPKSARKGGYLPFVLVVEATLDITRRLMAEKSTPIEEEIVVAFTNFMEHFEKIHEARGQYQVLTPGLVVHEVPNDVEQGQAHGRNRLAPLASIQAQALLRSWLIMSDELYGGVQKHVIAPKRKMEMRIVENRA